MMDEATAVSGGDDGGDEVTKRVPSLRKRQNLDQLRSTYHTVSQPLILADTGDKIRMRAITNMFA